MDSAFSSARRPRSDGEAEPAAKIVNGVHYAGANQAALPLIDAKIRRNPSIYPPKESSTGAS